MWWKIPSRPSSSDLIRSQFERTRPAVRGLDLAEHVRMAADQLLVHRACHLLEVALPVFGEQEREEVHLEEQVAELVDQLLGRTGERRIGDLVGLFDRVRHDRARGLLAVPRALPPQPLGQLL